MNAQGEELRDQNNLYYKNNLFAIVGLVIIVMMCRYLFGEWTDSISVSFGDASVEFSYGEEESIAVAYEDITGLTLVTVEDYGTAGIDGIDDGTYAFGEFHNDEYGDYTAVLLFSVSQAILIETEGTVYLFNYESENTTEELYVEFSELLAAQ